MRMFNVISTEIDRRRCAIRVYFEYQTRYYVANLAYLGKHLPTELMIFHSDEKGFVKDWDELCTVLGVSLIVEEVYKHIEQFCQRLLAEETIEDAVSIWEEALE